MDNSAAAPLHVSEDNTPGQFNTAGPLIAIGGNEDKDDNQIILRAFASLLQNKKLIVATVASEQPEKYFDEYRSIFLSLGIGEVVEMFVDDSSEAEHDDNHELFANASGVFFSGGDQMRIHHRIFNTSLEEQIRQLWLAGGVVAGTSAGASILGEQMIMRGPGDTSYSRADREVITAFGFLPGTIIDQHFAERGRFGRLAAAIAEKPKFLGLGVDEDTALIAQDGLLRVIGTGAVYVVDARDASQPSQDINRQNTPMTLYDLRVHVLGPGEVFDLLRRTPLRNRSFAEEMSAESNQERSDQWNR